MEPETSSDPEASNTNSASTPENTSDSDAPISDDSGTDDSSDTGTSGTDLSNNGDGTSGNDAPSTDESTTDSSDNASNTGPDTGSSSTDSSEDSNASNIEASRKFKRWLYPRANFTITAISNNTDIASNSTIIDVTNQTLAEEGKIISDWSFPEINFEGYNTTSDTYS